MMWFGDQWPSAGEPAPVCADRNQKVKTPVGLRCLFCRKRIEEGDQGVVTPYTPAEGMTRMEPIHLACLLVDSFGKRVAL